MSTRKPALRSFAELRLLVTRGDGAARNQSNPQHLSNPRLLFITNMEVSTPNKLRPTNQKARCGQNLEDTGRNPRD